MVKPPRTKKVKTSPLEDENKLIDAVWKHYCNYFFDDDEDCNGDGEIDELVEILDLLDLTAPEIKTVVWQLPVVSPNVVTTATDSAVVSKSRRLTRTQLLPVLISVVSTLLADAAIAEYMQVEQGSPLEHIDKNELDKDRILQERKTELLETIRFHLCRALKSFPENAAAFQMATNYVRMTMTTSATASFKPLLATWYLYAANLASRVRTVAIELMHNSNHDLVADNVKEWIVALLLNQVCGVDETGDDDDDNDAVIIPIGLEDHDADMLLWSASKIEGMSRFMSAMISSIVQQHDDAKQQLQLLGITHRLHPKLWQHAMMNRNEERTTAVTTTQQPSSCTVLAPIQQPVLYRGKILPAGGVLPKHLYDQLCTVFHPNAPYWCESSYASRDYYSFFMDVPQCETTTDKKNNEDDSRKISASNLMEDVVCNHLLPLVRQQQLQLSNSMDEIVGFEWWVHTRPIAANLGHNLHFDTDEASLRANGTISHPIISSVLYLTGGGTSNGGTTIILDQNPDATTNADRAWCSHPIDNSFMMFPGDLLHGVLPCLGVTTPAPMTTVETDTISHDIVDSNHPYNSLIALLTNETNQQPAVVTVPDIASPNRLTLMIGFWTRRVPDEIDSTPVVVGGDDTRLYGPCGPLPSLRDTKWVQDIYRGYDSNSVPMTAATQQESIPHSDVVVVVPVPCISPAWEDLPHHSSENPKTTTTQSLVIPREIDHRFFVMDAPNCFRTSMLEARYNEETDYDDDDDDDTNN
jgi:hypothetical protein